MKQKIKFEFEVEASRHDYYVDAVRVGCRRCVFYSICSAIENMQEKFPYSLVRTSELPCRQGVQAGAREYYKFSSK